MNWIQFGAWKQQAVGCWVNGNEFSKFIKRRTFIDHLNDCCLFQNGSAPYTYAFKCQFQLVCLLCTHYSTVCF